MSHVEPGILANYNSLLDPHLAGYFSNTRMRKHLNRVGLITRRGEIVSENTYRMNMARKEHKKHVRDLMAQAIVHKTLDMERNRQVAIKQKLEEIAKIELVRRVKGVPTLWSEIVHEYENRPRPTRKTWRNMAETGRRGDEDILPYLTQKKSARGRRSSQSRSSSQSSRPRSAPARGSRKRSKSPGSDQGVIYIDEDGYILDGDKPKKNKGKKGKSAKKGAKYPEGELDDKHLYALDRTALREYTMDNHTMDSHRGPSPYVIHQIPPDLLPAQPSPPPRRRGSSRLTRRQVRPTTSIGRPVRPRSNRGSLMLHRSEPAMKHQERVQTLCEVHMHYFGSNLNLDYEKFDARDEVMVEQQHCGGNTLDVFKEKILPGSDFCFTSRRHRGYPFSLTFYINGVLDCRLSACCEFKHQVGSRLGGAKGHFGILGVEYGQPCYRCQLTEQQKGKEQKKKPTKEKDDDIKVPVEEEKVKNTDAENGNDADTGKTIEVEVKQHDEASSSGGQQEETHVKVNLNDLSESSEVLSPSEPEEPLPLAGRPPESVLDPASSRAPDDYTADSDFMSEEDEFEEESIPAESVASSFNFRSMDTPLPVNKRDYSYDDDFDEDSPQSPGRTQSTRSTRSSSSASSSSRSYSSDDDAKTPTPAQSPEDNGMQSRSSSRGSSTAMSASSASSVYDQNGNKSPPTVADNKSKFPSPPKSKSPSPRTSPRSPPVIKSSPEPPKNDEPSKESDTPPYAYRNYSPPTGAAVVDADPVTPMSEASNKHPLSTAAPPKKVEIERRLSSSSSSSYTSSSAASDSDTDSESKEIGGPPPKILTATKPPTAPIEYVKREPSPAKDAEVASNINKADPPTVEAREESSGNQDDPNIWSTPDNTDTDGNIATESEDQAGGHDPENVAGVMSPRPIHVTTMADSPNPAPSGSIESHVAGKKEVDLSSQVLNDEQVEELCHCIKKNDVMQSLILRNSKVDDEQMKSIKAALLSRDRPNFQMLNLNSNQLTKNSVTHLVELVHRLPQLTTLLVHGNPFGDHGTAELLKGLVSANLAAREKTAKEEGENAMGQSIRQLTMEVMEEAVKSEEDRQRMEQILGGGLNLQQLDVGDCGMSLEAASAMADLLRANTPLISLSMTGNRSISLDGWHEISLALGSNTHVHTLSLDYNNLMDEGIKVIADGLMRTGNSVVKSLDLEGNKISDEGGETILRLVQSVRTLNDLTLSPGNHFSPEMMDDIRRAL